MSHTLKNTSFIVLFCFVCFARILITTKKRFPFGLTYTVSLFLTSKLKWSRNSSLFIFFVRFPNIHFVHMKNYAFCGVLMKWFFFLENTQMDFFVKCCFRYTYIRKAHYVYDQTLAIRLQDLLQQTHCKINTNVWMLYRQIFTIPDVMWVIVV